MYPMPVPRQDEYSQVLTLIVIEKGWWPRRPSVKYVKGSPCISAECPGLRMSYGHISLVMNVHGH